MAFFSLTTHQEHQQRDQIGPDGLFLYRNNNEDNSLYKGFELWHPQQQQQQQQQQQFQEYNFYSSARDMSVGSGRASGRRGHDDGPSGSGLEMMMRGGGVEGGGGGGVISCQDCGNQAKKDCIHMRCRTCCKSRGFDCQTHVKSTWVPASVRREKTSHQPPQQQVARENSKRLKDKRASSSSTGLQVNDFPPEFTSTATFRCVRVSSINDADEEYAYQTAVNIGGHVFKGILYDQGPDKDHNNVHVPTPAETYPAATPSTALFDSCNFPSPLGTFVSGTPIFLQPKIIEQLHLDSWEEL